MVLPVFIGAWSGHLGGGGWGVGIQVILSQLYIYTMNIFGKLVCLPCCSEVGVQLSIEPVNLDFCGKSLVVDSVLRPQVVRLTPVEVHLLQ